MTNRRGSCAQDSEKGQRALESSAALTVTLHRHASQTEIVKA